MKIIFHLVILLLVSCSNFATKYKPDSPKKEKKVFNLSWVKELDPPYESGNLPIGNGTPVVHADKVYFGNKNGQMRSYQIKNGRKTWDYDEKLSLSGAHALSNDNIIYTSYSGRVFSRNIQTGKLNYSIDLKAPIEYAALIHLGRAVFHMRNHQLVCLDAATGKILWVYKRAIPYATTLQNVSVPVANGNNILVGFADGYIASFDLNDGSIIWDKKISSGAKFVDVDVKALVVGTLVYAGSSSGIFHILDAKTGTVIRTVAFQTSSSAKLIDGSVYVGSEDGDVYKLDKNGNILIKSSIFSKGISSIVKWKDLIVATTFGNKVFALNSNDLSVKDEFDLGSVHSAVFGEMVSKDDYLVFYSSRNRLYTFK